MLNVNFNEVEDQQDFELLPAGEYLVSVEDATIKETQSGGAGINVKLYIAEGDYQGRYLFDWINVAHPSSQKCVDIGLAQLKRLVEASGIDTSVPFTDPAVLIGKLVIAKAGIQKGKDGYEDKNNVKTYKPASQPKPTSAAKPTNMAPGQKATWS